MFNFKEAVQRYRVAKRFGLPFNFCVKAFFKVKERQKKILKK